jgi:hypothetical protein|tara:strand:+ start:800 stop:1441 length:642 start_codon:yes stop_codon:yes gene_type:complete
MALNKLKFNSINVTPAAGEAIRFNSSANGLETASAGGALVKISSSTASSSATVSFTSGIDSTYKEYIFLFNNIHPATDGANIQFQGSTDGGSSYGVTITSNYFQSQNNASENALEYDGGQDLAQSTNFQTILAKEPGNGNDESTSGVLHLFDPSNTTFVKHFLSVGNCEDAEAMSRIGFTGGYFNTASAINAVQFKMSSGNMDAGTITMYGVK